MLSAATSCLFVETNSLHEYAADLAGQISDGTAHAAGGGHAASASERALTRANQTLASLGDAIAIVGMAQQEISLRRNILIQSALLKYIASICQNEDLPVKDKLFSGDVEKAIKSAREANKHSNKSTPSTSSERHHPYKRQTYAGLFFFFFFRSKRHYVERVSQPEGAGCETSNIPEKVWETPEAVMPASQEEAVSPENLMDEVSDFYGTIEAIKTRLTDRSSKFAAGQIQHCLPQWQEITHEEEILKMVVGVDIQLLDETPSGQIHQAHFSREQSQANDVEIEELLRKGVIVPCNHTEGEFTSPIFIRPKKDNKVRVILNLKKFNVNVENFHFKMETLKHALTLVSPDCFLFCFSCSLDLRDAYYLVHMIEKSQNVLKFEWKGQLYKYTAFPNGLGCCPRLFIKLLKPVMAQLHRWGFISTIFIDDTLLMGDSELECVQNVKASLCLFEKLGFVIHPEKIRSSSYSCDHLFGI